MLTFYKINQVHFYLKFSSIPPGSEKKQWHDCVENWYGIMKFCSEVNLQVVPSIDITNDVAELCDVIEEINEYLELFINFKFVNIGPLNPTWAKHAKLFDNILFCDVPR